jgi:hypothetical protein
MWALGVPTKQFLIFIDKPEKILKLTLGQRIWDDV